MPATSNLRAEAARRNGARSRGPKTPEGLARCAEAAANAARRRAVAVNFDCTLLPTESRELLEATTLAELAHWQPASPTERQLVLELVDINWKIRRVRFAQTNALLHSLDSQRIGAPAPELASDHLTTAVIDGAVPGGDQLNLERAISLLTTTRARILRDLDRLSRRLPRRAGSQESFKTNNLPAENFSGVPAETLSYPAAPASLVAEPTPAPAPEPILPWAARELDYTPKPAHAELLTAPEPRVAVCGPSYSGKAEAAAIRALHEAVHHPGALILCAGLPDRLIEKARALARRLRLALLEPPPHCAGFALPNGSRILALPTLPGALDGLPAPRLILVDEAAKAPAALFPALEALLSRSNGALVLLSSPGAPAGFFQDAWSSKPGAWRKITVPADAPAIPGDLFRRAVSGDIKPVFGC